jgi:hypothetical protein
MQILLLIDACRRIIISPLNKPAVNREQELKINTLQNAPRDLAALEALILRKEKQKDKMQKAIETDHLCTEIEMLQFARNLLVRRD